MFVAKFSQVSADSDKFEADDNGNMPFIGEVLAGVAKASIINGTIFMREGLKTNTLYVCETKEVEGTRRDGSEAVFTNVIVLGTPSFMEYAELSKVLGKGKLVRDNADVATEPVNQEQTIEDLLGNE